MIAEYITHLGYLEHRTKKSIENTTERNTQPITKPAEFIIVRPMLDFYTLSRLKKCISFR